jgi:dTDP-6-deoxy-L-talose 4-dehydrogenase (NAD+)
VKVLVTGATGFVGRHVVGALVGGGHEVIAVARDESKARSLPWHGRARFVACDVFAQPERAFDAAKGAEAMVHLAWPGLPNYRDFFHLARNLPADLRLLEHAVDSGLGRLVVAGTCLEYGLQCGALSASQETRPTTPYGLAKDTLRKSLEMLQRLKPFTLQWVRLFYMHGEGQNANSLLAQLDRAIDEGKPVFDMSPGDQLRDYLPIAEVAATFRRAVESPDVAGVINCCSGEPVSVRELVERRIAERGASIRLNRGHYPYPDYEPLAFWGVPTFARDR